MLGLKFFTSREPVTQAECEAGDAKCDPCGGGWGPIEPSGIRSFPGVFNAMCPEPRIARYLVIYSQTDWFAPSEISYTGLFVEYKSKSNGILIERQLGLQCVS